MLDGSGHRPPWLGFVGRSAGLSSAPIPAENARTTRAFFKNVSLLRQLVHVLGQYLRPEGRGFLDFFRKSLIAFERNNKCIRNTVWAIEVEQFGFRDADWWRMPAH